MFGESRWKVLVLIAGLLLAQAIDSPGRGSLQLKNVRQLRRTFIPNFPSQWTRHSRSFQDTTALSADVAETGIAGYPEYSSGARRSRVNFRDDQNNDEVRLYENYSANDRINDSYSVGPSSLGSFNDGRSNSNDNQVANGKVSFVDDSEYDTTAPDEGSVQLEEERKPKPLYAEAFDRQQVSFPQTGRDGNQQFTPNQRYSDYNQELPRKLRNPNNVGFPLTKSYYSRYPVFQPYFVPPNPEYDNYYGNPYHNDFNPLVKNGFFGPGFAPKSPHNVPFWKTRTPRVVFPNGNDGPLVQSNSHQGGTGNVLANANNYNNDNVVFRDQNFGLNELAAIQDIRNDFNLQDIGVSGSDDNSVKDKETLGSQNQLATDKQSYRRGKSISTIDTKENQISSEKYSENASFTTNVPKTYFVVNKIIIDVVNKTEDQIKVVEQSLLDMTGKNVSIIADNVISAKIDPFGPITEYLPPRGAFVLPPNSRPINRIPNKLNIPSEVQRKPIPGTRTPKTLQYLLPFLTNNKKSEAAKAAPYLAPSPPFENEIKDFNENKRDDGKKCNQGGSCEFFLYCWMSGGLLDGTCGLLKGCCHKLAKAASLGVQDSNVLDNLLGSDPGEPLEYGPVINDNSK